MILTFACNECLCLARVDFLTRVRSMARISAIVLTDGLLTSAELSAWCCSIFALASAMAELLAEMNSAFQLLSARKATTHFSKPTRLVLEIFLPAYTGLFHEERAFGAGFVVIVALMLDLWMPTRSLASAVKAAWWRTGSARLRWVESGATTGTAYFVEHCFKAAATRSLMAEFGTKMSATFERSSADLEADVFGLKVLINRCRSVFAFSCLSFTSFLLTRAATLAALMPSAVESGSVDSSTARRLFHTLMAYRLRGSSSTTTGNLNFLETRSAFPIMAGLLAEMTTR